MHLAGTIEITTDDGKASFTQDITFVITDIRPLLDGKPGSEDADRSKMKVTLMSPDADIRVYEIDITIEEVDIYRKVLRFDDMVGFSLVES